MPATILYSETDRLCFTYIAIVIITNFWLNISPFLLLYFTFFTFLCYSFLCLITIHLDMNYKNMKTKFFLYPLGILKKYFVKSNLLK